MRLEDAPEQWEDQRGAAGQRNSGRSPSGLVPLRPQCLEMARGRRFLHTVGGPWCGQVAEGKRTT